jgi:hypothetical protein
MGTTNSLAMRTRAAAACLLLSLGCAQPPPSVEVGPVASLGGLEVGDTDVMGRSQRSIPLQNVVAIPESEFGRLLTYRQFSAAEKGSVREVMAMASAANARDALGLIGSLVVDTEVTAEDVVVVMLNPAVGSQGDYQTTRFHFAGVRIAGPVAYAFRTLSLHFETPEPITGLECSDWRGCRPSPSQVTPMLWSNSAKGGAGLPSETLMNMESSFVPQNAAGNTVELRMYPGADLDLPGPNSFVCAGETQENKCSERLGAPVAQFEVGSLAIEDSAVVSESQFDSWIRDGSLRPPRYNDNGALIAAQVNVALNHPASRGIVSTLEEAALEVAFLLVVRDPFLSKDERRLEGSEVYVVPGPFRLPGGLLGLNPRIIFNTPVPWGPWPWPPSGVCGPIAIGGTKFSEGWLGGMAYNKGQSRYGSNRSALNLSKSTIRFPFPMNGELEFEKLGCSILEPPDPLPQPICVNGFNPTTGQLLVEECNGVDDNCNGLIDESGACEVPVCQTCVPATCGTTRCSTLPDGCGQSLTCACP